MFSTVGGGLDVPEGGIKDGDVIIEELERVTIDRWPPRHSKAPSGWLRGLSRDICRYRSTREEEDGDPAGIPLH